MVTNEQLVKIANLKKYYLIKKSWNPFSKSQEYVRAVDDVSFALTKGKILAVVGESGCGKTTLARTIALLTTPTSGEIYYRGKRIDTAKQKREIYRNVQMVFQDPDTSLDPRLKIGEIIAEPLKELLGFKDKECKEAVKQSLLSVGLQEEMAERNPRALSGGQKQRVAIARAIAIKPELVILDEPTSALDVSIQAQILKLLLDLQSKYGLTYLFVTHNMSVAKYTSDEILVMYAGKVVEHGSTLEVLEKPLHPYTKLLISATPVADPWNRNLLKIEVKGETPSLINPPSGCRFHPRCPFAKDVCSKSEPTFRQVEAGHFVACHFAEEIAGLKS
jgi:peptide/nickel transport system ATP-binding protein